MLLRRIPRSVRTSSPKWLLRGVGCCGELHEAGSQAGAGPPASPDDSERREKMHVPSGCESRPATVAPAGSNRSVGGGNELDEASV